MKMLSFVGIALAPSLGLPCTRSKEITCMFSVYAYIHIHIYIYIYIYTHTYVYFLSCHIVYHIILYGITLCYICTFYMQGAPESRDSVEAAEEHLDPLRR